MYCINPDCKKEILKQGARLNETVQALHPGESGKIETENGITFVRCPYCGARNIKEDLPAAPGTGFPWKFGRYDFEK